MSDFETLSPADQAKRMQAVAQRTLAHWALEGASLSLIKYRENAVFAVEKDGSRWALRIHRPGYHTNAELRSELQWMKALSAAHIDVPQVVPNQNGELFISESFEGVPGPLQIDVFDWIEGEQLGSVEGGVDSTEAGIADTYRTVGELAARLHNQASVWTLPPGFTRHAWDEHGLAGEQPFWGRFWELPSLTSEQRSLLERTKTRVFEELSALSKDASGYSMIHADFAPENLMVDGTAVRLIDFDDAGFGWHLFEVVTSLYFVMGEDYFETAQAAVIEGYRKERTLSDEALERLPLFYLARGTTYVGWVHTRPETETAQELTPMLVNAVCELADDYL